MVLKVKSTSDVVWCTLESRYVEMKYGKFLFLHNRWLLLYSVKCLPDHLQRASLCWGHANTGERSQIFRFWKMKSNKDGGWQRFRTTYSGGRMPFWMSVWIRKVKSDASCELKNNELIRRQKILSSCLIINFSSADAYSKLLSCEELLFSFCIYELWMFVEVCWSFGQKKFDFRRTGHL